jgi:hypothetical protein
MVINNAGLPSYSPGCTVETGQSIRMSGNLDNIRNMCLILIEYIYLVHSFFTSQVTKEI